MDDHYELVSKDELKKLRDENKKLKEELENKILLTSKTIEAPNNRTLLNELRFILVEHSKREQQILVEQLTTIKNFNAENLNSLIEKTTSLDNRLETMVENLKSLLGDFSKLIEEVSHGKTEENEKLIENLVSKLPTNQNQHSDIDYAVMKKLEDIERFLTNLRILLSYVKPNSLTLEKPSLPSSNPPEFPK